MIPPGASGGMGRRGFLGTAAKSAAVLGLAAGATSTHRASEPAKTQQKRPVLMKPGHQHDHSETTLQALAAFGVNNICSGKLGSSLDDSWSVEGLTRLRKYVESFGLKLDCVPLPLSSSYITKSEHPEIMLAEDPARDRTLEEFRQMIRNCGKAGIPMVKYNLTFIGVVRTERTIGRGGASLSAFDFSKSEQEPPLTEAGRITDEIYWDRISYFLKRSCRWPRRQK